MKRGGLVVMRIWKWVGIFIIVFVLVYGGWVLVAMNRKATISVDYFALLNETAAAVPEVERAWPLYREAGIALRLNPIPSRIFWDEEITEPTWPDQEGWNHYILWLEKHASTLETIYKASTKSGLGHVLSNRVSEEDKELWPERYALQQGADQAEGFSILVLMPPLAPMRSMVQLLSIDAKNAAANGDAKRCLSDFATMLAIGTHVREHPLLLSDLVSFSIYNLTFSTVDEIMEHDRTLFSSTQLDKLAQEFQGLENNFTIRFDGERMFILDLLQRVYTDDGNGDGSIIPIKGAKLLSHLEIIEGSTSSSLVPSLLAPIADMCLASRKEMRIEFDRRLAFYEQQQLAAHTESTDDDLFVGLPWTPATSTMDPFYIIEILTAPSYESAIGVGVKTRKSRDALLDKIVSKKQPG